MTGLSSFLERLSDTLEGVGLAHMFTGSLASTFHGEPRSTQDIDVVVALPASSLTGLLRAFPEESYYVSEAAARDAIRRESQFNVIDLETGWKADLIVKKDRPYSDVELTRRIRATVAGVELWLASAEDTIVSKLEWAKRSGGSERQLRDVRGVLERNPDVELDYIERWVADLGLDDVWRSVRDESL